jgi:hypothetical protein
MITARQYEEKMIEYAELHKENPEKARKLIEKLNIDTLECLGYAAGTRIYEQIISNPRQS